MTPWPLLEDCQFRSVYATSRVLEQTSFSEGGSDALISEDARRHAELSARIRVFRTGVVGRALDEGADELRLIPRGKEVEAVLVRGKKSTTIATLDAETWEQARGDVVFRFRDPQQPLYARRGDKEFALTTTETEDGHLVLEIRSMRS